MATLAESFLADLEDLSDDERNKSENEDRMEEDELDKPDEPDAASYDDLYAVAKLTSDPHYQDVMARVRAALEGKVEERTSALLEDDPTYKLLVECNKLAVDIDNEVVIVHNFMRDKFRLKFPELESLVRIPPTHQHLDLLLHFQHIRPSCLGLLVWLMISPD
eukprot:GHUV01023864.1.p1 GENE.GHUV01023864.1~~GHUV01023864.1.p1  ORF type:complete len:163 (+),score=31.89 GHUV01023864.1:440-928(+)